MALLKMVRDQELRGEERCLCRILTTADRCRVGFEHKRKFPRCHENVVNETMTFTFQAFCFQTFYFNFCLLFSYGCFGGHISSRCVYR